MKKTVLEEAILKRVDHENCEETYLKDAIKLLLLEHMPTDDDVPAEFEETWVRAYHLRKFGLFEDNADICAEIYSRRMPFAVIQLKAWQGKGYHNRVVVFPIGYVFDYFKG